MWRILAAALAIAAGLCAQDPDDAPKVAMTAAAEVRAGQAQFQQACSFCHGKNARGASGPDLIHSSLVSHDVDGNLIGVVVRGGRPDKGMPAFPLFDAEIRSLAAYLHEESRLAYSVYQRGPGDYPLEKLLVGNAEAGKRYFDGAGHCTSCHSADRDLAHIATKYKPVDLQSRLVFPAGSVPAVTVTDKGRVFTGSQVYADEFTIALRDPQGWIHSWNRHRVKVAIQDPLAEHVRLLSAYTDENMHDLFAYLETLK